MNVYKPSQAKLFHNFFTFVNQKVVVVNQNLQPKIKNIIFQAD